MPNNTTNKQAGSFDPRKYNHRSQDCLVCKVIDGMLGLIEQSKFLDSAMLFAAQEFGIADKHPSSYIPQVKGVLKSHAISLASSRLRDDLTAKYEELSDRKRDLVAKAREAYVEALEHRRYIQSRKNWMHKDDFAEAVLNADGDLDAAKEDVEVALSRHVGSHPEYLEAQQDLRDAEADARKQYSECTLQELLGVEDAKFKRDIDTAERQLRKEIKNNPDDFWTDADGKLCRALFREYQAAKDAQTIAEFLGESLVNKEGTLVYEQLSVEKLSHPMVGDLLQVSLELSK